MKISDMPKWVLEFKKKGYTIRVNGDKYALYKVTSIRVPDKKYPKLIQEYIGIITKEGIISKKTYYPNIEYKECLSFFIYHNFKRDLKRVIYGEQDNTRNTLVIISIIKYVFGIFDIRLMEYSHLDISLNDFNLTDRRLRIIELLITHIEQLLKRYIKDDYDRLTILYRLKRSSRIDDNSKELILKWGLRHD